MFSKLGVGMLCILMVALAPYSAFAGGSDLERFARAIGLPGQIQAHFEAAEGHAVSLGRQQIDRLRQAFPEMPQEVLVKSQAAYERFISEALTGMIDPEKATKDYLDLISTHMSSEDMAAVTAFYESEPGRKFASANEAISQAWADLLMRDIASKISGALKNYEAELQTILIDHPK